MYKPASSATCVARIWCTVKGKTFESILLRQSYREGGQVTRRTLAHLTHWLAQLSSVMERTPRRAQPFPAACSWATKKDRGNRHDPRSFFA
ncbi:MAG: hypothetical protein ACYDAG_18425 [Chloroflexota bacterium]